MSAEAAQPDADLVVFLDGGPGGAASEDYPALAGAFAPICASDTGCCSSISAVPAARTPLSCDRGDDESKTPPGRGPGARARVRAPSWRTRAAPQFYTTSDAVEDLEAVRQALGGPQLDLLGVSYGTRLAQQYAHTLPPRRCAPWCSTARCPTHLALRQRARAQSRSTRCARCSRAAAPIAAARERFGDPYETLHRVQRACARSRSRR